MSVGYTDYGPNPYRPENAARFTVMLRRVRRETEWRNRPFCDLCGPFRGRYLRRLGTGEHRCRGCDRENGLEV